MAATSAWIEALEKIQTIFYKQSKTTEVYSRIKSLGFKTVDWLELEIKNNNEKEIENFLQKTNSFILEKNPCLFIFDPKIKALQKGYLFDVLNNKEIENWVLENKKDLQNYSFLVTSQIVNDCDGFVGSVYSNAKGKIFCETLHLPRVCNHRELSQPKTDISKFVDFFATDNFEAEAFSGKFLDSDSIHEIVSEFADKKGYFEFVKGAHLGKQGIFVTGFEDSSIFCYPESLQESLSLESRKRIKATAIKHY